MSYLECVSVDVFETILSMLDYGSIPALLRTSKTINKKCKYERVFDIIKLKLAVLLQKKCIVTRHTEALLKKEGLLEQMSDTWYGSDLSRPAYTLLRRMDHDNTPYDNKFWSTETLKNIVLNHRELIEEEISERFDFDCVISFEDVSDDALLEMYFDHTPTRGDLVDYVWKITDHEYEIGDVGDIHLYEHLMNGVFYGKDYYKSGWSNPRFGMEQIETCGNLDDDIALCDWKKLAIVYGIDINASKELITETIINEQNELAIEILSKGYDETVRGFSYIKALIQSKDKDAKVLKDEYKCEKYYDFYLGKIVSVKQ